MAVARRPPVRGPRCLVAVVAAVDLALEVVLVVIIAQFYVVWSWWSWCCRNSCVSRPAAQLCEGVRAVTGQPHEPQQSQSQSQQQLLAITNGDDDGLSWTARRPHQHQLQQQQQSAHGGGTLSTNSDHLRDATSSGTAAAVVAGQVRGGGAGDSGVVDVTPWPATGRSAHAQNATQRAAERGTWSVLEHRG